MEFSPLKATHILRHPLQSSSSYKLVAVAAATMPKTIVATTAKITIYSSTKKSLPVHKPIADEKEHQKNFDP
jgi:hypothetical protein